jgi:hypothetical protein
MDSHHSWTDVFDTIAPLAVGLGMLTFIIVPFALPLLLLTAAAALPLLAPVVVLGIIGAMIWGVALAIRAAGRGIRRLGAPRKPDIHGASIGHLRSPTTGH